MKQTATAPSAPARPLIRRWWYRAMRGFCRLVAIGLFRIRATGRENLPADGAALLICNHQSQLDPAIVGLVFNRQLNYLARETLFRNRTFGRFIGSLEAIPIDREGTGLAGLKETLRRLKRGEPVLLFPEGTRAPDGRIQPFRPGFTAVARRAAVPVVPIAVAGAYESLPRDARWPRFECLQVVVGKPLLPDEFRGCSDDELSQLVENQVRALFEIACRERAIRKFGRELNRAASS